MLLLAYKPSAFFVGSKCIYRHFTYPLGCCHSEMESSHHGSCNMEKNWYHDAVCNQSANYKLHYKLQNYKAYNSNEHTIEWIAALVSDEVGKGFFCGTFHNMFQTRHTLYLWLHRYQWKKLPKPQWGGFGKTTAESIWLDIKMAILVTLDVKHDFISWM